MSITEAEVFAQAVDNAGFLWSQRDSAARDPRYDLKGLAEVDGRLAAQLDLLGRGGRAAWDGCAAAAEGEGGAGEVFAALSLALVRRDQGAVAALIAQGRGGAGDRARRGVGARVGGAGTREGRAGQRCSARKHSRRCGQSASPRARYGGGIRGRRSRRRSPQRTRGCGRGR